MKLIKIQIKLCHWFEIIIRAFFSFPNNSLLLCKNYSFKFSFPPPPNRPLLRPLASCPFPLPPFCPLSCPCPCPLRPPPRCPPNPQSLSDGIPGQ